jgi:hypothetical protein
MADPLPIPDDLSASRPAEPEALASDELIVDRPVAAAAQDAPDLTLDGSPFAVMAIKQARDLTFAHLSSEARERWVAVRQDLNQPFFADKYARAAVEHTKEMLDGFLAQDSSITLREVEKSLGTLKVSLKPAKSPEELEKSFWQRVGEARNASYLGQLRAIYAAARDSTENNIARTVSAAHALAISVSAQVNALKADRAENLVRPRAPGATSLAPADTIATFTAKADRVAVLKQLEQTFVAIKDAQAAPLDRETRHALKALTQVTLRYVNGQAAHKDLQLAAEAIKLTQPKFVRSADDRAVAAWAAVQHNAQQSAAVSQTLATLRAINAPSISQRPTQKCAGTRGGALT